MNLDVSVIYILSMKLHKPAGGLKAWWWFQDTFEAFNSVSHLALDAAEMAPIYTVITQSKFTQAFK